MVLSRAATKMWLDRLAGVYDVASDAAVARFAGRASFGHADLMVIYQCGGAS